MKNLDIGMLILNAGTFSTGPIELIEDNLYENVWNCTGLHVVYLTKALVKGMLERDQRCAILITSSIAAQGCFPCNASYSGTKRMVTMWGESLFYELK